MDPLTNTIKIERWFSVIRLDEMVDFCNDHIDGLVGQIFGVGTASRREDSHEPKVNSLVLLYGFVAVGIQPGKQLFKTALTWWLSLAHLVRQLSRRSAGVMTDNDMDGGLLRNRMSQAVSHRRL